MRAALTEAVTDGDIREATRGLIASAKDGDTCAIKKLLDRTAARSRRTSWSAWRLWRPLRDGGGRR